MKIMSASMEDEILNVSLVGLAAISSLCYCHFISAKLLKGEWRLISLAPVFCVFAVLPLYTKTVLFTIGAATMFTWLASFRLLLFAFGRGPLASFENINLPIFIAMASLPFKIKPKDSSKIQELGEPALIPRLYVAPPMKLLGLSLATEIPVLVIVVSILQECNKHARDHAVVFLMCWCLTFLFIEIVCQLSSVIVYLFVGLDLEPPSNKPYLSSSLQEFWGRRWNQTLNHIMRETVYKPVRSASAVILGRLAAAAMAVVAAFLISGLVHELMLWYITRESPSWEITLFFILHGVCVVAESGLKVALTGKGWRLPLFLSRLLTVGFVAVTSFWMVWPPVRRSGADVRAIEELRVVGEVAKECAVEFWLWLGC